MYIYININIFLIFSFSTDKSSIKTVLFNETSALSTTEASEREENSAALNIVLLTIAVFLVIVVILVCVLLKQRSGNLHFPRGKKYLVLLDLSTNFLLVFFFKTERSFLAYWIIIVIKYIVFITTKFYDLFYSNRTLHISRKIVSL